MTQQEIKGNLARLLATENLVVEHKVVETASFDVDRRVLTLPIWQVSGRVYDMLVGHEVGHALFTPCEDWADATECPKSYLNICEDARIEKLMKRKFPGLNKDFYHGYQQLNQRDFFGIQETDVETLNLIDRVNLYFKIGAFHILPFDGPESDLRDAVGAAETFQETIAAAIAIYKYSKDQQQDSIPSPVSGNTDSGASKPADSMGDSEESEQAEEGDTKPQPSDNQDDAQLDTPSFERGGGETSDLDSKTDEAFNQNLKEETNNNPNSVTEYVEIDNCNLKHHIVSSDRITSICDEYWANERFTNPNDDFYQGAPDWTQCDANFRQWKRANGREVSYLAKEFEMKKAASAYARASVAKTGVLDTSKLHQYLYNEDLFKKVTVTADGKNHGLIFILDWSGSMCDQILDTYKQTLSLAIFCRKVGIPFQVLAFTQDGGFFSENFKQSDFEGRDNTFSIPYNFFLMEFLSSEQNNHDFDTSATYLWRICSMFVFRNHYNWDEVKPCPPTQYIPTGLNLSGTPLNESLAALQTLIPSFKKKHGVEKVHISILTDGEAQWSRQWRTTEYHGETRKHVTGFGRNTMLRDRKTGRTYEMSSYRDTTHAILKYLKGRFPNCNFLGFRIGNTRDIMYTLADYLVPSEVAKQRKLWTKNKSIAVPFGSYQQHYFLSPTGLNSDVEFDPKSDSKADIRRAYTKSLQSKANNKKILSSFIEQIA